MHTFKTLLLREWMQHHRGWLILAAIPLVLALPAVAFGQIEIDGEVPAAGLMLAFGAGYVGLVMMIALSAVVFQAPGMARRDWQDRSIEFWQSLPVPHWQPVAATQVSHLLLMPALVLGLAMLAALPVAMLATSRVMGPGAVLSLPWATLGLALLAAALRLLAGLLLGMLWLAPITLGMMAAAAWLKGWGPVALAATVGLIGGGLAMAYDNYAVLYAVRDQVLGALDALIPFSGSGVDPTAAIEASGPGALPGLLLTDIGQVLGRAADPMFVGGLALAALAFWLQVLRRARGG